MAEGVGAQFGGRLEFDADQLRMWGLGFKVHVHRTSVKAIRFGPGWLDTRISPIMNDSTIEQVVWFSTTRPDPIEEAFVERGWTIFKDENFTVGVPDSE